MKYVRLNMGFTLIELLITVVLFSLVMTSLMVGLHTGVNSWKRVRAHQAFMAESERALNLMAKDLRHMVRVSDEHPVLVESEHASGSFDLQFTALIPRIYHSQGRGAVWAEVQYRVSESDEIGRENSLSLQRLWSPHVAQSGFLGRETEQSILSGIQSVDYQFLGESGLVPNWEDAETLPRAVLIRIQFDSGKQVERMVSLPLELGS